MGTPAGYISDIRYLELLGDIAYVHRSFTSQCVANANIFDRQIFFTPGGFRFCGYWSHPHNVEAVIGHLIDLDGLVVGVFEPQKDWLLQQETQSHVQLEAPG